VNKRLGAGFSASLIMALAFGLVSCGRAPFSNNQPFVFGLQSHGTPISVTLYGFFYSRSSAVTVSFIGIPTTTGVQRLSNSIAKDYPASQPTTDSAGTFVYGFTPICVTHDASYDNSTDLVYVLAVDDKTFYSSATTLLAKDWYCPAPPPPPPPPPPHGGGHGGPGKK
jgi:hypothetical protein